MMLVLINSAKLRLIFESPKCFMKKVQMFNTFLQSEFELTTKIEVKRTVYQVVSCIVAY